MSDIRINFNIYRLKPVQVISSIWYLQSVLMWCTLFIYALFQKSACISTKYMKFVPVLILKLSHYVCASYAYISQRIFFLEKFINVFSTVSKSLELNWSGKKKGCVTYITALVRASYKEVSITPRLKYFKNLLLAFLVRIKPDRTSERE